MIDNVITGPVSLRPGQKPIIDERAWDALIALGDNAADYMLMHYEPSGFGGRLVAAFKHCRTRQYRRVNFWYASAGMETHLPYYEPMRDVEAARRYLSVCERSGMRCENLRRSVVALERRAGAMKGGA